MLAKDDWEGMYKAQEEDFWKMRAALAGETERAEKAEAELGSHIGKQALKEVLRQMLANAEAKEALAAQVERLRTALDRQRTGFRNILDCRRFRFGEELRYGALTKSEVTDEIKLIESVLAETPAQSLAAIKAEVLNEAYRQICASANKAERDNMFASGSFDWSDAAVIVSDMAERLEKEAGEP